MRSLSVAAPLICVNCGETDRSALKLAEDVYKRQHPRRTPQSIHLHHQSRWQVELFFKWIKQHLRIKAFYGYTENAVKTQVRIAVSVYVLVAIFKKRLGVEAGLHEIL